MFSQPRAPSRERGRGAPRPRSTSRPRSAPSQRGASAAEGTSSDDPVLGRGLGGIRALRRQRGGADGGDGTGSTPKENRSPQRQGSSAPKQRPTSASAAKVDAARRYLAEKVDPLMSEIINFLLLEQPEEADEAILRFLGARRAGGRAPQPRSRGRDASRQAMLRDRLYMAKKVQPVLEQLMRRVVEEQPADGTPPPHTILHALLWSSSKRCTSPHPPPPPARPAPHPPTPPAPPPAGAPAYRRRAAPRRPGA